MCITVCYNVMSWSEKYQPTGSPSEHFRIRRKYLYGPFQSICLTHLLPAVKCLKQPLFNTNHVTRPHYNRRPMTMGTPTNGLGALEISLLLCYSLTCNGLGVLSGNSLKMALKLGALQNPYFEACACPFLTPTTFCDQYNLQNAKMTIMQSKLIQISM